MATQDPNLADKIRQQFDTAPYPRVPLDRSPISDYQVLFIHNLITSYYLKNQRVIETAGKVILDAGCGSGYKSLILAYANPGAKIVGIDLSEQSVKLAYDRLQYHGFNNVEFFALPIEEITSLNLKFDYINIDEVLYLLPDLTLGLKAIRSVLNPQGIVRANLHSSLQRYLFFQSQAAFKKMGFFDRSPGKLEIELVKEVMNSLKQDVMVKAPIWNPETTEDDEWICANYLLTGDKGYTIPEMFTALKAADLEFLCMVNWQRWKLESLFKEPKNLPPLVRERLLDTSIEKRLYFYELLQPIHRLLDFWCTHGNQKPSFKPVSEWTIEDWQGALVYLHPQLKTAESKADLIKCVNYKIPFEISRYLPLSTTEPIRLESSMAACLLPLWEGATPVKKLVERWLQIRPVDPLTLEPLEVEVAWTKIEELLSKLENYLYVLLERNVNY